MGTLPPEKLTWSVEQTAQFLKTTPAYVLIMALRGLPTTMDGSGHTRVNVRSLNEWLNAGKQIDSAKEAVHA